MIKRITILIAIFYLSITAFAAPVNLARAKKIAVNALNKNGVGFDLQRGTNLELAYQSVQSNATFYVFNAKNSFIIIAGDDAAEPVLAYSAEGNFDAKNIPPATKYWLQMYESEIAWLRSNAVKIDSTILHKWKALETESAELQYAPQPHNPLSTNYLVKTKWGQAPIYNNLCPVPDDASTSTPTGCVATAMAQIMRYWWVDADVTNYCRPSAQGRGTHSYSCPPYGTQSANFGATTYDFANMPISVGASSPAAEKTAVATLMYHCGVSVDMKYNTIASGGSSSYASDAATSLCTYFGYVQPRYEKKTSYVAYSWMKLLKDEIDADRPVIYRGDDKNGNGGHAWICDGYDNVYPNYFHMNWGWGGIADGWFLLTALDPNVTPSYNFISDMAAVVNIQPECAQKIPFCENFDSSVSGRLPVGWQCNASLGSASVKSGVYYSASNSLNFTTSKNTQRSFIFMPLLDVPSVSTLLLSFWARESNADKVIEIGVVNHPNDITSFALVKEIKLSKQWKNYEFSLAGYAGSGKYIAIRTKVNTAYNFYIDDISISACGVSNIKATEISNVSAKISWDNIGSPTSVQVEYGVKGFTPGSGTVITATGTNCTLSGLTQNTIYDVYVTANCGSENCNYPLFGSFSTAIDVPYCENFDSSTALNEICWNVITAYPNYPQISSFQYLSGGHSLFFMATNTKHSFAVLPQITASINTLMLSFAAYSYNAQRGSSIDVGVMTNPNDTTTFTLVQTVSVPRADEWFSLSLSLSSYAGSGKYIALKYSGSTSFFIDNIYVGDCGIKDVAISDILGTSAKVSWANIGSPTPIHIEYGLAGFTPGSGTVITSSGTNYTFTGLLSSTKYDVYLTPNCSSSCNSQQKVSFTTARDVPYCENFDSYNSYTVVPPDWSYHTTTPSSTTHISSTYNAFSARNVLNLFVSMGAYEMVVLPPMAVTSVNSLYVSFFVLMQSSSGQHIDVGVMTDPTNVSTYTTVQSVTPTSGEWGKYIVSLASYSGSGKYIALRYSSISNASLFLDNVSVDYCSFNNVETSASSDSAVITWTSVGNPNITIEYGKKNFVKGTGTKVNISGSETTCILKNLDCASTYDLYVYSNCGCHDTLKSQFDTKICPTTFPLCENFDQYISIPDNWSKSQVSLSTQYCHSATKSLLLQNGGILITPEFVSLPNIGYINFWAYSQSGSLSVEIGTISDPLIMSTYTALQTITLSAANAWEHISVPLTAYNGTDKYIVIRYPNVGKMFIDDLSISECADDVLIVNVDNITTSAATVHWTSSASQVVLEYGIAGFAVGTGTKITLSGESEYTIENLSNVFAYDVYIYPHCSNGDVGCTTASTRFNLLAPYCMDFTDLYASNVICTYGSFYNPYANIGVIDYGSSAKLSRHTVHTDRNEKDPRTENKLSTVPPDGTASVRLGNWANGAEAESITYKYSVDASQNPILLLQYAAVMEDPEHEPERQPHLKLEILDASNNLINPTCGSFDFVSSAALGWNSVDAGSLYWKDWTTVGLDLTPYDGQTIKIRMTNYDCSQAGHYGYAYLAFKCADKKMTVESCGNNSISNTFTAPNGFEYSWYTSTNSTPFSHEQSITAAIDGVIYYCDLSYVGIPNCKFTLQATATLRYPLADFTYTHKYTNCSDTIRFANASAVSSDGITPNSPLEKCDNSYWDFGNGQTTNDYTPLTPIVYTQSGTYTIKLVSSLAGGMCVDSIEKTIQVTIVPRNDTINDVLCPGKSYKFGSATLTAAGTYTDSLTDAAGCDSVVVLVLTEGKTDTSSVTKEICANALPYTWNGKIFTSAGTQNDTLTSTSGCDSIVQMTLIVSAAIQATDTTTICANALPYTWNGKIFTSAGTQSDTLISPSGCDSIVQMTLIVSAAIQATDTTTICANALPYTWNGKIFTSAGTQNDTLISSNGCDSIVQMTLIVSAAIQTTDTATICANALPYTWNGKIFTAAGTQNDTLISPSGCDSIVQMTLIISAAIQTTDTATICANALPYTWNGKIFNVAGTQNDTLTSTSGCDSIVQMTLIVSAAIQTTDTATICANALPYTWNGKIFTSAGTQNDTLTSTSGCDSIVQMTLIVSAAIHTTDTATICANALPYTWNGKIFTAAGTQNDTLLSTSGCDSIVQMTLIVSAAIQTTDTATICANALPYTWNGKIFTSAGTQNDTLTSANGCDSIVQMTLIVSAAIQTTDTVTICANALPYTWNGKIFNAAGTQNDTLTSTSGCDSIVQMTLIVSAAIHTTDTTTICANALPYTWNGKIFTSAGTQNDTLTSANGCDSIVQMTLIISAAIQTTDTATICANALPYTWNGKIFTSAGTQNDTLTSASGCDSIVQMTLIVSAAIHTTDTAIICANALPYTWNGKIFTSAGTQNDTLTSTSGCDSIVQMTLIIRAAIHTTDTATICANALPYTWNGKIFNAAGTQNDTLTSTSGCDSIVQMTLIVSVAIQTTDTATICANALPYTWNGKIFTSAGTQNDTLTSSSGCDSIVQMTLIISAAIQTTDTATICANALPYTWNGKIFTSAGTQNDTLTSSSGCDSIVQMTLIISAAIQTTDTATICANALPYTWNGKIFTSAGTQNDTLLSTSGCDSIVQMTLIVSAAIQTTDTATICANALPYTWNGKIFNAAGTQNDTLTSASGCDSIVQMTLIVNTTTYGIDTISACETYTWIDGITYTESNTTAKYTTTNVFGCDSIVTLNLKINHAKRMQIDTIINYGETYNINGFNESEEGTYTQSLTSSEGCDSVVILNLQVIPSVQMPNAIDPSDFSVNPQTMRQRNHFGPIISGNDTKYEYYMLIFDRWNNVVFETRKSFGESINPAKHYWDGTFKGKNMSEDAYLYYIKIRLEILNKLIEKRDVVYIFYKN